MDKEDCIQVILSTLQQPLWKSCDSVTDWDLKNVLWKAGLLLTPEQVAALFADVKRRGLISARDRRNGDHIVALWGARITPAGAEWLSQRELAAARPSSVQLEPEALSEDIAPPREFDGLSELIEPTVEENTSSLLQS